MSEEVSEDYAKNWQDAVTGPKTFRARVRQGSRHAVLWFQQVSKQRRKGPFLRCLYCHYVFDDQKERFSRLMDELCGLGQFVDTQRCLEMIQGKQPIDGCYFHLSFDDGFRNVITNALPALEERGVPAVVFVPTARINSDYREAVDFSVKDIGYKKSIEMARWEDLRSMNSALFEVGSHTRNHLRLSNISHDAKRLREEILGSKSDVEMHVGRECRFFSWPFGRLTDIDNVVMGVA